MKSTSTWAVLLGSLALLLSPVHAVRFAAQEPVRGGGRGP